MVGTSSNLRDTILGILKDVANEQHKNVPPLTDDLPLLDSGLDSLCMAITVARLEDHLGFDPFDSDDDIEYPVTVGDFIKFYENAARDSAS